IPRFCTDFSRGLEAELPLLTIGEVQQPGPDGFSSKYEGQFVKIQGRISGPSYVYGSGSSPSCYLEDTAGGINVYAPVTDSLSGLLLDSLGVEFLCIGRVTEYNGLTELANGVVRIADRAPVPVRPRILGFNRFLSEELESKLISVAGDVITPPAQAGGGVNFTIKNGNAGITIRVVSGAPIPLNWVTTGKRVYCTGIVGQYSTTAPFGDGYQLMPRLPEDLVDSTPGLQFDAAMRIEPEPRVFNPGQGEVCRISITSPADRRLDLQVFDLEGRLVRELLVSVPGHSYQVVWDGTDDRFRRLPLGTYILNLKGLRDNGRVEAQCKLVVIGARF
ncbi:MAG: hypothetical protein ABIK62_07085, partial [candidate division WOR-3 bacterium]